MNKNIQRIVVTIPFAIMYGLIIKYTNKDVAIISLLFQIYIELFIRD